MTDVVEEKRRLRRLLRAESKNIAHEELVRQAEKVFGAIECMPIFRCAVNIAAYSALSDELPTMTFLARWAQEQGKNIYLPRIRGKELDLVHVTFASREPVNLVTMPPFGILEPVGEPLTEISLIDLIIVPGMAFDRKGNRLGRGKGYYDRLLAGIDDIPLIGVARETALFDEIPCEPHDRRMDYVVTENHIISDKQ